MTAKEFFESQLITDLNSAINKNKRSFNHYDVIKFAEEYYRYMTRKEQTTAPKLGYQPDTTYTVTLKAK